MVIRNIGELCMTPTGPVRLNQPRLVRREHGVAIGITDGLIRWIRADAEVGEAPGGLVVDAGGGCVIPGLIDCHTHTVFTGTREAEYVQRIEGRSYAAIAEAGGGIRSSIGGVRAATIDELVEQALPRLARMLRWGVTTVEIKSGYGLSVDSELKMLQAVAALRDRQAIELVGTYLAAHTVPPEFDGRPDAYLDAVLAEEVLACIVDGRLAEFADVFCERTAFTVAQARRVLTTCAAVGLAGRVHADQITQMGASRLAAEVKAVSADHLETVDDASLAALAEAGVIGVLLPACSFFLGVPQAPARRIIEVGIPVAVATDFNPGSCMVESLPLAMSIACSQMRLTPEEALVAATSNAAAVLQRADRLGSPGVGMQADLVILDVPNLERMVYETGRNCVRTVIKRGEVVASAESDLDGISAV